MFKVFLRKHCIRVTCAMPLCANNVKRPDVVVATKAMLFNASYVTVNFRVKIVSIDIVGLVCLLFYAALVTRSVSLS